MRNIVLYLNLNPLYWFICNELRYCSIFTSVNHYNTVGWWNWQTCPPVSRV